MTAISRRLRMKAKRDFARATLRWVLLGEVLLRSRKVFMDESSVERQYEGLSSIGIFSFFNFLIIIKIIFKKWVLILCPFSDLPFQTYHLIFLQYLNKSLFLMLILWQASTNINSKFKLSKINTKESIIDSIKHNIRDQKAN